MKEQINYLNVAVTLTGREVFEDGYEVSNYSNLENVLEKTSEVSPILCYVRIKETYSYGYESKSIENYTVYFLTEDEAKAFFKEAFSYADYARDTYLNLERISVGRPAFRKVSL